ncbi:uncharacterized protein LOC135688397 [Rhopilema esculentum]|uniref:uncharacterized protein LOC135688397 n=1 Tax=Rhopilema esculentum TaxID=499914 RepID=UPI0031D25A5D|eukprot:gene6804-12393_t
MLKVVKNEGTVVIGKTKEEILENRRENLKRKNLRSVFFKNTEFRDEQTWNWLRKGNLKKATEGTIMAAQEQAIRSRSIRHCIDKEKIISSLCRLCGERDETIAHFLSECKILCQTQYKKWRHYKIVQVVYWQLCKAYDLEHIEKWYDHHPEKETENKKAKILWDMKIQTDKILGHSRPDIVDFEKESRTCKIVDVACPFDTRVAEKEREKVDKYQELKYKLKRI